MIRIAGGGGDGIVVTVEGLAELQRDLRAVDRRLPRELTRINREISTTVEGTAQSRAGGYGGVRAKASSSIKARAQQRYALIGIGGAPYAAGAFLGAKRFRQFPSYVGAGDPEAIYAVGDAIREEAPTILRIYADRLEDLID
jgi:hypothetical protein